MTQEELDKEYIYVFGEVSEKEKEELLEALKKEFIDLFNSKYDFLCSAHRQNSDRPIPLHFKSVAVSEAYKELESKYMNISPRESNVGWLFSKIWGLNCDAYNELTKFIP